MKGKQCPSVFPNCLTKQREFLEPTAACSDLMSAWKEHTTHSSSSKAFSHTHFPEVKRITCTNLEYHLEVGFCETAYSNTLINVSKIKVECTVWLNVLHRQETHNHAEINNTLEAYTGEMQKSWGHDDLLLKSVTLFGIYIG